MAETKEPKLRIHFGMALRDAIKVAEVLGVRVADQGSSYRFDPPAGGKPYYTYKTNRDVNGEVVKLLLKVYQERVEQERQKALAAAVRPPPATVTPARVALPPVAVAATKPAAASPPPLTAADIGPIPPPTRTTPPATLADLVADNHNDQVAHSEPPRPDKPTRKIERMTRPQQRQLEDWLALNWNTITASHTTRDATARSAATALGLPQINRNHVRVAVLALGKVWPWKGRRTLDAAASRTMYAAKANKFRTITDAVLRLYREWGLEPPASLVEIVEGKKPDRDRDA